MSPKYGHVAPNGRLSGVQRMTCCQGGRGTLLTHCHRMLTAACLKKTDTCCNTMFWGAENRAHEIHVIAWCMEMIMTVFEGRVALFLQQYCDERDCVG